MFVSFLIDIGLEEGTQVRQLFRMYMEFKIRRIFTGLAATLSVDILIVNSYFVCKHKKMLALVNNSVKMLGNLTQIAPLLNYFSF